MKKTLSGIACVAVLAISCVTSTAAIASTANQMSVTQSVQSTESTGQWVKVVYRIPIYVDGVLVGHYEYVVWEYRIEP